MLYQLYAIMRNNSKKIKIFEYSDMDLMQQIINQFNYSENILRFIITSKEENQEESIIAIKELDFDKGPTLSLHK